VLPSVLILVVVAITQAKLLRTEVGKDSMTTVVGHGSVGTLMATVNAGELQVSTLPNVFFLEVHIWLSVVNR